MEAYLSDGICRQHLRILASVARRDMMEMVRSSHFIGIMIDETLDISITEQMVIYYRIVGPDGHVKVVFAGIEELDAGDALTITTALLSKLARDEIPLSKVMSFGSDGASVMTGHLTGVAARILRPRGFDPFTEKRCVFEGHH